MPRHSERRLLPYPPEAMFDLVADIERYPEFLPWCCGAKIRGKQGNQIVADLTAGTRGFKKTFTSIVDMERPRRISVSYGGGLLETLSNEWEFVPREGGCEVTFFIEFSFRSPLYARMAGTVFDKAFRVMVAAFEQRAEQLYGRMP